MPESNMPEASVRVHRLVRAPRERVYQAWIDPSLRSKWWAGMPGMTCELCEIDAKPGGKYRVSMNAGDKAHTAYGEFVELSPFEKISFTWSWEHGEMAKGSLVTVELYACEHHGEPATEVILAHERLNAPIERSEHQTGWLGCLKSLGVYLAEKPMAPGSIEQSIDIESSIDAVYEALTTEGGITGWWTKQCRMQPVEGGRIELAFGDDTMAMEILDLSPGSHVRWRCIEQNSTCNPTLTKKDEWVGTALVFRLTELEAGKVRLHFVNDGLTRDFECYEYCVEGWTHFLGSLRDYCQTGSGSPFEASQQPAS